MRGAVPGVGELVCGFRQIRSHELIPRIVLARPIRDDAGYQPVSRLGLAEGSWVLPGHPGRTPAGRRLVGGGGLHGGRGDGAITHPDAQLAAWR